MEVFKEFKFDAAHRLPSAPEGHKCRQLHGHTYRVVIHVEGEVDEERGWIVDFADIKAAMKPLLAQLDHHYLNEIEGLDKPTAESLADWFWRHLITPLPGLCKVVVCENESCGCIHTGPKPDRTHRTTLVESKQERQPIARQMSMA